MDLTPITMLFTFIGGLGMFLYGMHIMADGLQHFAGGKMQKLMGFLTKNRLMAILVGAFVTAVIQSSSATTVMVVGFVNAGMLNLAQAVGVIMGANIGTTITAWLVSLSELGSLLKPEFYAPLLLGIGAFIVLFTKSDKKKILGEILIGFSVLFIGLSFMSDAIKPYRDAPIFAQAFTTLGKNPLLGILTGAIVTAIIQSSSASVGILQTLAMNGVVPWSSAIFITLGQNIGTCITAVMSSAGAGRNGKRASVIHLLFNVIGAVVFGIMMYVLFVIFPEWGASNINSFEISVFHTIFNVSNTLILLPFGDLLVKLSKKLVPGEDIILSGESEAVARLTRSLDKRILNNPSFAITAVQREVAVMGRAACENLEAAIAAIREGDEDKIHEVYRREKELDGMVQVLTSFLVEVDSLSLTEAQHELVKNLFYTVSDLERVGDRAENIAEEAENMKKNGFVFSAKGQEDLVEITEQTMKALVDAVDARETNSRDIALSVRDTEARVDDLEEELRDKHIRRLAKGKCQPESGVIFLEVISNLERIADHAVNIADYVTAECERDAI